MRYLVIYGVVSIIVLAGLDKYADTKPNPDAFDHVKYNYCDSKSYHHFAYVGVDGKTRVLPLGDPAPEFCKKYHMYLGLDEAGHVGSAR